MPNHEQYAWTECRGEAFYRAIGVAVLNDELHSGGVDLGKRDQILPTERYNVLVLRHLDKKFHDHGVDSTKGLLVGAFAYVRFCPRRHHDDDVVMQDNGGPRREVGGIVVVKHEPDSVSLDEVIDDLTLPKVIFDGVSWRHVSPNDAMLDYIRVDRGGITSPFQYGQRGIEYKIVRKPEPFVVPDNLFE